MPREPDERVVVEPLSEARWGRVERSLFAKLDEEGEAAAKSKTLLGKAWSSPWRAMAALAAAAGFAAAAGGAVSHGLWRPSPAVLASHIATGTAGSHVALAAAALDVGPDSDLDVSGDDDRGVLVVLDRGRVECEVTPRQGRAPFVVQAGDVRVRVVGTQFAVTRDSDGVSVDVTRGVVEVESHGEVQQVRAGGHWPTETPAPGSPAVDPGVTEAVTSASAHPVRTSAPPAGPRASALREARPPASDETSAVQAPRPAPTPEDRYEAAARVEATDPDAALAIYGDLSRGSDAWSANALFAAARLELDRGHRARARRLLEQYLGRFPRGANAVDARDLLEKAVRSAP